MSEAHDFDDVLHARPPSFTEAEAANLAREAFAVSGSARSLGSERDQAFLIEVPATEGASGRDRVLKISNAAEDPARIDMEALAVLHVRDVDPGLPVAIPKVVPGADPDRDGPAAYRAALDVADGRHYLRLYDRMPGTASVDETSLSDEAVHAWGATVARLARSLRGFFHPSAQRVMLWDVQHTPKLRAFLDSIDDSHARGLVLRTIERFEEVASPRWPELRAQILHGDLTSDNALVDDDGYISGIVDFGDMSFTALVVDLASVMESMIFGRDGDEVFRVARLVLDGYQRITPLEPLERDLIGESLAARLAANVAISAWRARRHPAGAEFTLRFERHAISLLDHLVSTGWDEVRRQIAGPTSGRDASFGSLLAKRRDVLGSALVPLEYEHPLHMVRGEGTWLFDADGRRYLDAYNNVPCVGHAHPRVTEAIARQTRALNTNMRYLHETVLELAERLIATTPSELDTVMFVNSGSEANDLAWRIATIATGNRGAVCTSHAYHGVTEAIAAVSPENWPGSRRPDHVETFDPPDPFRGKHLDESAFASAVERLRADGRGLAAVFLDGVLTSDGIPDVERTLLGEWLRLTREAGGLWVADEVQGGHGRTGDHMWSFERFGIVPDLVTLGKPMGNGHPVAAVIARSEVVDRFASATDWFSTFAGNPVSAAAAVAVLDVLHDERVLPRVATTGEALRVALREATAADPRVGEVRGIGLAIAVELVSHPVSKEPDGELADRVANAMRERGVLIGTTGRHGNCLKIRPPLAFGSAEVPLVADALRDSLASL
jgi:4-aminobutyrate aminotransferase-like enzyme